MTLLHTPCASISSRCITDLNVNAKTVKLLEENVQEYLCDLHVGKGLSKTGYSNKNHKRKPVDSHLSN